MDTSDGGILLNMGGASGYPAGYTQDQVEGKLPYILYCGFAASLAFIRYECPAEPDTFTAHPCCYVS